MLALERLGISIEIGSIYPPLTSMRHEHAARLKAPIYYAPPQHILRVREKHAKADGSWPAEMVEQHEQKYGTPLKAAQRARNVLYFADLFARHNIEHCHTILQSRRSHGTVSQKMSGITFSVSAYGDHGRSGHDELLGEIPRGGIHRGGNRLQREVAATAVPRIRDKIHRVYNGMDLGFISPSRPQQTPPTTILSVGRRFPSRVRRLD
jgi:hypothetical protein